MENLKKKIEKKLLTYAIMDGSSSCCGDMEAYIMTKRQKIISYHTKNVCPIYEKGEYFYTKLCPDNREHNHKVSAKSLDNLYDKIVAYYLEIDYQEKLTLRNILILAVDDLLPETKTRHVQTWDKYFSHLSDKKIVDLSEKDIRESLQNMINDGIKAKAYNNAVSTLNKIADYCLYNHISCISIRDKIQEFRKYKLVGKRIFLPDSRQEKELAFSEEEAVRIIAYSLKNPDYIDLAICFLIVTGLRAGELLALEIDDLDIENGTLWVGKMEKSHSFEIVDGCKDGSERTVFLNQDALKIAKMILKLRKEEKDVSSPYLFLNPLSEDNKAHLRAIDNRLRKIQRELDFPSIRSPHDCRRTYASIQYLHGVDIKTIQMQLGHKKASQTWEYVRDIIDASTRAKRLEMGCIL